MQSVSWYVNRLKGMSAAEILWRINALGMAQIDRVRVACGILPNAKFKSGQNAENFTTAGCRICDRSTASTINSAYNEAWKIRLLKQADKILANKLSYFDLTDVNIDSPSNWHLDQSAGKCAPLTHINTIDYRDFDTVGDCKLVWEPNRHHQLVVLARAYRITGDKRYAEGIVEQLESWMEGNPFGKGMNWRSPLELGVRLINWVWAIDLSLDSGLFSGAFGSRLIQYVYRHCWDVSRKLSKGSSANNHLVGEAAGLYVAATYFDCFQQSQQWAAVAKDILEAEIYSQSYDDGCTREQALGYQFFVLQFYLVTGLLGKRKGDDFSPAYWKRIELMMLFVARLAEGGDNLPMFGDRDDGYVLDLGEAVDDTNALCALGAALFKRDEFYRLVQAGSETAYWLLGNGSESAAPPGAARPLQSCQFGDSGYFLLQYGTLEQGDKASVLFDCAELGYQSIAAHGHADALSFTLRLNNIDCLVDTGTYDYFSHPQWRNYFRKTRAHNTCEVDDMDQSEMQGPFMWGDKAHARCLDWSPGNSGGTIVASHDGYTRLSDPVVHSRRLDLQGDRKKLVIKDQLEAKERHNVALYFHFSDSCKLVEVKDNVCVLDLAGSAITLTLDQRMRVEVLEGSKSPIGGWLSRGYHRKTPVPTVVARARIDGSDSFNTCLSW
ncbi:MAG: alginate lyase family protein [Exilibacterium sp.]